jgi:hypothetical protein
MRSDTEINAEIAALKKALTLKGAHHGSRWSVSTRKQIEESIAVLEQRTTSEQIEREHYLDEASEEYTDGDNDLYHELIRVHAWLNGERDSDAPSETL